MKKMTIIIITFLLSASLFSSPTKTFKDVNSLIKKYVNKKGYVNYKKLKINSTLLIKAINSISNISAEIFNQWNKKDKIAFLINAYNVFTIKLIIDNYPVNSIMEIGGAFKKFKFKLLNNKYSLDEIENKILRKNFKEPRIHMALVCAALSCPILRNEAYTGIKLNKQLSIQVKHFFNLKTNFKIDEQKKILYISSIVKWYKIDFDRFKKKNHIGLTGFIYKYYSESLPKDLKNYKIKYLHYSWVLNKQ